MVAVSPGVTIQDLLDAPFVNRKWRIVCLYLILIALIPTKAKPSYFSQLCPLFKARQIFGQRLKEDWEPLAFPYLRH